MDELSDDARAANARNAYAAMVWRTLELAGLLPDHNLLPDLPKVPPDADVATHLHRLVIGLASAHRASAAGPDARPLPKVESRVEILVNHRVLRLNGAMMQSIERFGLEPVHGSTGEVIDYRQRPDLNCFTACIVGLAETTPFLRPGMMVDIAYLIREPGKTFEIVSAFPGSRLTMVAIGQTGPMSVAIETTYARRYSADEWAALQKARGVSNG